MFQIYIIIFNLARRSHLSKNDENQLPCLLLLWRLGQPFLKTIFDIYIYIYISYKIYLISYIFSIYIYIYLIYIRYSLHAGLWNFWNTKCLFWGRRSLGVFQLEDQKIFLVISEFWPLCQPLQLQWNEDTPYWADRSWKLK